MVFKLAKVFMSASMMEKVKLCSGDIFNGDINDCPMAKKLVPIENIPSFLGGKCECPNGCVANIPNSQTHKKGLDEDGNVMEQTGEKTPQKNDNDNNATEKSPASNTKKSEKKSKKKNKK